MSVRIVPLTLKYNIEDLIKREKKKKGVIRRKNLEEVEYAQKIYLPFIDLQSRLIRMEGRLRKLVVDYSVPTVMLGIFSQNIFLKPFSNTMQTLFSSDYRTWSQESVETKDDAVGAPLVMSQIIPQDVVDWIKEKFQSKNASLIEEINLSKVTAQEYFDESKKYRELVRDAEKEMRRWSNAPDSTYYQDAQRERNKYRKETNRVHNVGLQLIKNAEAAHQRFRRSFIEEIKQAFDVRNIEEFFQSEIVQTGIFFVPFWFVSYSRPVAFRIIVFDANGKIVRYLQEWMTADLEFRVLIESVFKPPRIE